MLFEKAIMSSSKQKSGRPQLANQETKKKDQSRRGCRKLQFEAHKPLKGKSFYLDVRKQSAKLKKDLEDLGGVVETFLSKDVNYVVSDRPEVKLEYTKNAGFAVASGASPAVSTPSPFQQSKDSAHGAANSPNTSGTQVGMVTRGKAIVQKATISQTYGSSNVLANAHNWGVNIRFIDSVIKYINKEKKKMKEAGVKSPQIQPQQGKEKAGTSKAERKLSKPSLKAEDASCHYRPATKEMSSWPRLSMDGPSSSCPFDVTVSADKRILDKRNLVGQEARGKQDQQLEKEVTHTTLTHRRGVGKRHTPCKQKAIGVKDNRRGYCECCLTKYADLEKHLTSEQHKDFVRENNHYANLDIMIDEGPNMDQFLDDVIQHHEWQRLEGIRSMEVTDEVHLVSSPNKRSNRVPVDKNKLDKQHEESQDKISEQPASSSLSKIHSQPLDNTQSTDQQIVHQSVLLPAKKPHISAQSAACLGSSNPHNQDDICDIQNKVCDMTSGDREEPQDTLDNQKSYPSRYRSNNHLSPPLSIANKNQVVSVQQHEEVSSPIIIQHSLSTTEIPEKRLSSKQSPININSNDKIYSADKSPETPSRRSSRLSLSSRRRQLQSRISDTGKMISPIEGSTEHNVEERAQVSAITPDKTDKKSANTSDTSNKRFRSLRLSFTARKRLLKEMVNKKSLTTDRVQEAPDSPDPNALPGYTLISSNETNIDIEEGITKIQDHSTQQETQKVVGSGQRRKKKRKRKSNDPHDSGLTKKSKIQAANACHQQHIHQNKKGSNLCGNEPTREEKKAKRSTCIGDNKKAKRSTCIGDNKKAKRSTCIGDDKKAKRSTCIGDNKKAKRSTCIGDNQQASCHSENELIDVEKLPQNEKQLPAQTSKHCIQQPNLEAMFYSDPNMVQSSFLGFSSDDITETEQRLQQLSASSMCNTYTDKLQEAALNVCCIPSSELCLPEEDDGSLSGSSDITNMEEVVVGMALRNLANFPSDGSDWEAKVGGFMSVRLDKAMQIKKRETMTQACIQGKENVKENQYIHIEHIPDNLATADLSRQLKQSSKTPQSLLRRTVSSKEEITSKTIEQGPNSVDSEVSLTRRTLNYDLNNKTRSSRQNRNQFLSTGVENVGERTNRYRSPLSLDDPCRVASSNVGILSSPIKSKKPVCSTPRHNKSQDNGKYQIVFSPDTPVDERTIILEHYVHDISEEDIDFPKFSSPGQSDFIVSPIKNFTKNRSPKKCSGSPYKLKAPRVLKELPLSGSSKKSLFPGEGTPHHPCQVECFTCI